MSLTFIKREELQEKPKSVPVFGTIYTDYMFEMTYNDELGWHNPTIKPYADACVDPAGLVFHYAQAVFEGMKGYRNPDGGVNLFRPMENLNRLNRSLHRMCMPEVDAKQLLVYLKELLKIEEKWIYNDEGSSLYIRPYVYATQPQIGVKPSNQYTLSIILLPVGPYFSGDKISILVEENYVRAVEGGTGEVKCAGNYGASILAITEAKKKGYNDVLWLDAKTRSFAEEIGTMNVFFRINDVIITPRLSGTILPGITRASIIQLCKSWGIEVEERDISIDELQKAHRSGELKEIFGTGTAAVVTPINSLIYRDYVMDLEYKDTYFKRIKDELVGIQKGEKPDVFHWVERVI